VGKFVQFCARFERYRVRKAERSGDRGVHCDC
jgi:hypothetical protein